MTRSVALGLIVALCGCSELPLKDESGSTLAEEMGSAGAPVLPRDVAATGGAATGSSPGAASSPPTSAGGGSGGLASGGAAMDGGGGASGSGASGEGGATGGSGVAGSAASGSAGGGGASETKLHAALYSEITQDPTNELHPFLLISNDGPYPLELRRIKVRYYVSAESPFTPAFNCFYVTGALCAQLLQSFGKLPTPRPDATHFIEFSFRTDARVLGATPLEIRTALASGGEPMTQANDFSYVDSHGTLESVSGFDYERTERVTVYLDGKLVWGTEPCPK